MPEHSQERLSDSVAVLPEKVGAPKYFPGVGSAPTKYLGQIKILNRKILVKKKHDTLFIQILTSHAVRKRGDPLPGLLSIASGPQELKEK